MSLKEILSEVFAIKEEEYKDAQSILILEQFDSMNHMVFISKIEEVYKIELTGDEIMEMMTIGQIKKILQSKGIEQ